jgi:hypothetical protein
MKQIISHVGSQKSDGAWMIIGKFDLFKQEKNSEK